MRRYFSAFWWRDINIRLDLSALTFRRTCLLASHRVSVFLCAAPIFMFSAHRTQDWLRIGLEMACQSSIRQIKEEYFSVCSAVSSLFTNPQRLKDIGWGQHISVVYIQGHKEGATRRPRKTLEGEESLLGAGMSNKYSQKLSKLYHAFTVPTN
jgi:hypothetical protein